MNVNGQNNVLDLTPYLSSSSDSTNEPPNGNACYFKAYQNLSELCLEPYKNDLLLCDKQEQDDLAANMDPNEANKKKIGCKIMAEQKAFKCMLYKILSDTKNYTYNHCTGENLKVGSTFTEDQQKPQMATQAPPQMTPQMTTQAPPQMTPQMTTQAPPQMTTKPSVVTRYIAQDKEKPVRRNLAETIFTIFKKKED